MLGPDVPPDIRGSRPRQPFCFHFLASQEKIDTLLVSLRIRYFHSSCYRRRCRCPRIIFSGESDDINAYDQSFELYQRSGTQGSCGVNGLAHDLIFNVSMQWASVNELTAAAGTRSLGAGLIALLGKWA